LRELSQIFSGNLLGAGLLQLLFLDMSMLLRKGLFDCDDHDVSDWKCFEEATEDCPASSGSRRVSMELVSSSWLGCGWTLPSSSSSSSESEAESRLSVLPTDTGDLGSAVLGEGSLGSQALVSGTGL
jgi:hypothetical protein